MPFNCLHPFGFICRFPPAGLSTTSGLYVVSISELLLHPCASQQLPACIWFQYLGFPCLSTTSCAHLVSISNFPPMCLGSNFLNFLHSLGFNIYALQGVQRPSPCDTLGFPTPSHSALFFSISTLHTSSLSVRQGLSLASTCVEVPHLGAFVWIEIPKLPPLVPLSNFLHSFAWSQDFPSGLLTTFCMHYNLVSMSRLPLVSQQLLALIWFQYLTFPLCLSSNFRNFLHSLGFTIYSPRSLPITSCVHFVLISKLPPRCPSTTSCIYLASIFPVPLSNFLHSFGSISGSTVAS